MKEINMKYENLLNLLNQIDNFDLIYFATDNAYFYSDSERNINTTYLLNIIEKYIFKLLSDLGFEIPNVFSLIQMI